MATPSEVVKELAQQCCDEIKDHCYREWEGIDNNKDSSPWGHSDFDEEKALNLIELYLLRALADSKPD